MLSASVVKYSRWREYNDLLREIRKCDKHWILTSTQWLLLSGILLRIGGKDEGRSENTDRGKKTGKKDP